MKKITSEVLIEEINRCFQVNVRFEMIDTVLTMLGELSERCNDAEAQQKVYETYQRLIKWAWHDNHYVIVNILLWHGRNLILKYGSEAEREMLETITGSYKVLSPKERLKYNFTEIVYDRLAAYELQIIKELRAFSADVKRGGLSEEAQRAKVTAFCACLNFIKIIPIPNGYPVIKTEPLGSGHGKVAIRTEIVKYAYLKIRLYEAAAEAFRLADQGITGKVVWSNSMAAMTAAKFRNIMRGLKEALDKYIRHAEEDQEALAVYLNPGYAATEDGINTDEIEFGFATYCGFKEKTFRDFFNVYPKDIAGAVSGFDYHIT